MPCHRGGSYIKGGNKVRIVWPLASAASLYGAIAGSFFEETPLTAIAFALLGVVFAIAAYLETVKRRDESAGPKK